MTVAEPLILFSRADCHLCELASAMLDRANIDWRPVDIDEDPELVGKYGLRVPVLKRPDSGHELDYPFDLPAILKFAGSHKQNQ